MEHKHIADYYPSLLELTPSQVSLDSLGAYFLRIFLEFFLKLLNSTMVAERLWC